MKYTELKQIVNESLINPRDKNLPISQKLMLEADNPDYWLQKAIELLREVQLSPIRKLSQRGYEENLLEATTLLTLCRYKNNEKDKIRKTKTRNNITKSTDKVSKSS